MSIPVRNQRVPAHDPGVALTDTIGPAVKTQARVKEWNTEERLREAMSVLHRGPFETLYLSDQRIPTPAQWNLVPFPVLTFLVSQGYTLEVNALSLSYSESILGQSQAVGWRLTINGMRVPNMLRAQIAGIEWSLGTLGDALHLVPIDPVWVQSNESVALEVIDLTGTMTEFVCMTGVLSGRLYPNMGGVQ